MPRLRRPTGPRRAAMRAMLYEILWGRLPQCLADARASSEQLAFAALAFVAAVAFLVGRRYLR